MPCQDSDPEERGGLLGIAPIKVGSDSDDSEDFKDVVSTPVYGEIMFIVPINCTNNFGSVMLKKHRVCTQSVIVSQYAAWHFWSPSLKGIFCFVSVPYFPLSAFSDSMNCGQVLSLVGEQSATRDILIFAVLVD